MNIHFMQINPCRKAVYEKSVPFREGGGSSWPRSHRTQPAGAGNWLKGEILSCWTQTWPLPQREQRKQGSCSSYPCRDVHPLQTLEGSCLALHLSKADLYQAGVVIVFSYEIRLHLSNGCSELRAGRHFCARQSVVQLWAAQGKKKIQINASGELQSSV